MHTPKTEHTVQCCRCCRRRWRRMSGWFLLARVVNSLDQRIIKIEKCTTKVHFKMTFFKTYLLYFIPSFLLSRLRRFSSLLQRFVTSGGFYTQQFGTPPKRTATKRTFTLTNYYHPPHCPFPPHLADGSRKGCRSVHVSGMFIGKGRKIFVFFSCSGFFMILYLCLAAYQFKCVKTKANTRNA